jgi:hypothetical protein
MSYTNVYVVNHELEFLNDFLSEKSEENVLCKINENLTVVILNEYYEMKTSIMMELTKNTPCFALHFISSENNAWYYALYQGGELAETLEINYTFPEEFPEELELFKMIKELNVIESESLFHELCISLRETETERFYTTDELFLKSLGIDAINRYSFEDFEDSMTSLLKIKGLVFNVNSYDEN